MKSIPVFFFPVFALWLMSCSGHHSTLSEGYAYRIDKAQAATLVDSTLRVHVASDRMLPGGELVASGYDRVWTDTQTYTVSAIPVTDAKAFGLEVKHEGTMFNGPAKAERIYEDLKRRAGLLGARVPLK